MPPSNKGSVLATFYPTGFGDPAVAWQTRFLTERIPLAIVGDCWGFGDCDGWEKFLKIKLESRIIVVFLVFLETGSQK